MSRQDQYNVTVVLEALGTALPRLDLGTFDKLSGGEVDSEETKYRPGNMGSHITLGGSVTVGNLTVSRLYEHARDHTRIKSIINRVGKADVTISKQSLDVNGAPFGTPLVYKGKLKACTPPEVDSESSDAAMLELEITSAKIV